MFEKLNLRFLKQKFDKEKDISKEQTTEFDLPLINAKDGNNGIMYYGRSCDFESAEMAIDIVNDGAVSTGNVYPQPQKTGVLYNAYLVKPLFPVTERLLYFFSASIQKSIKLKFGYENKAVWEKVKKEKISLPVKKDREIDFAFMEDFISQLEACRLSQLEAYLLVTGLKNYTLTPAEEQALTDFQNGNIEWGEFKVVDLFDVKTSKKRFDANKVKVLQVGYPYVVRTALNNGIKGFLNENEKYLNLGNTISFGQDTATIFYQEKPYFTGDKIKILEPKHKFFGKKNAQFIITVMEQSFRAFSWGSSSFSEEVIKTQYIYIPIQKEEINFEYMETLISAVQKLVIKDVVEYTDRKIEATKKIINK